MWADRAMAHRVMIRERIETDAGARADVLLAASLDPAYDMVVFGSVFEPRSHAGRPKGWYPAIPFEFQVRLIRWIEEVRAAEPGTPAAAMGRGDGVLEKARAMAGSWTFAMMMAHRWRNEDGYVGGLMSYKADAVEKSQDVGTLFHKVESYLGLDPRVPDFRMFRVGETEVPVPIISPPWLVPEGYEAGRHNLDMTLSHPYRTNVIAGYTTTPRAGTGTRLSELVADEAAKFDAFGETWDNMSAVTDHRFAISSPDTRWGTAFRDLARHAERATTNGTPGPAFLRLRPDDHPYRDEIWREEIESRHSSSDDSAHALSREYDLSYESGGTFIYPAAHEIVPKALAFNPANEMLDFCIDPATNRDMCAIHLVGYDPGTDRYKLLASYANTGKPAEFYASIAVAQPMTGTYEYDEDEWRMVEWFEQYGRRIRFWVGDPAGKQKLGSHNNGRMTSFYDDFRDATARLAEGRPPISIYSSDKHEFKRLPNRWAALRWLLPKMDFNDTPDVLRTVAGLQDHRLPSKLERETTAPQGDPVRHPFFDRVTALEYYAVHRKIGWTVDATPIAEPLVLTMSGKVKRRAGGYRVSR